MGRRRRRRVKVVVASAIASVGLGVAAWRDRTTSAVVGFRTPDWLVTVELTPTYIDFGTLNVSGLPLMTPPPARCAVPEPAGVVAVAATAALLGRRRRA